MTRHAQGLPRSFRAPRADAGTSRATETGLRALAKKRVAVWGVAIGTLVVAAGIFAALSQPNSGASQQKRVDLRVAGLLVGLPQRGRTLGYPNAPVTLEVFADLKDPDSHNWFDNYLPSILAQDVRTGRLQLRFHAFKTNTGLPQEFVAEQAAALSASVQNKLWNFAEVFYHQRRNALEHSEFEHYVTTSFLESVARQVGGLNIAQWQADLHTERREELPSEESKTAHEYELHVTPSFRIGLTEGPLTNYAGSTIRKYNAQNPISFIKAEDLNKAIKELESAPSRARADASSAPARRPSR